MENRLYPIGTPVIVGGMSGEIVSESFSAEGVRYVQVKYSAQHYQWHNSRHVISEDDVETAIWEAQPEHAR